ncbi:hypothetical protein [uncultured Pontibacter sp.]|uniref:hypothetical protein n=1 Tax=uncultured Pontibacter sp. TaxID=453356 RepID=UPI00261272EF|nr:hypothetical protein [uncultured Pontibacter sp.]
MLKFVDSENFGKFMKTSISKDAKQAETLSAQLGIRSLSRKMQDKAAYSAIAPGTATQSTSSWTVVEDDELVPDPYFASVLNDKREVAIGDHIFRITSDGTFMYKPGKTATLENLLANKGRMSHIKQKPAQDGLIEVEEGLYLMSLENNTDDNTMPKPADDPNDPGTGGSTGGGTGGLNVLPAKWCNDQGGNVFGTNYTCEQEYANGDRRIKGRFWSLNYGIYATIGSNTRCQNYWGGAWWAENAAFISVKWDVDFQYKNDLGQWVTTNNTGYLAKNENNNVEKVFEVNTAMFMVTNTSGATITQPAYGFRISRGVTNHVVEDHNTRSNVNISAQ